MRCSFAELLNAISYRDDDDDHHRQLSNASITRHQNFPTIVHRQSNLPSSPNPPPPPPPSQPPYFPFGLTLKKLLIFFMPLVSTFFSALTPLPSLFFFLSSSSFFRFFSSLSAIFSSSSSIARLRDMLSEMERRDSASDFSVAMAERWVSRGVKRADRRASKGVRRSGGV